MRYFSFKLGEPFERRQTSVPPGSEKKKRYGPTIPCRDDGEVYVRSRLTSSTELYMAGKKGAKGLHQQKQLKSEIEAEMNNIGYRRQHRDTRFIKRSFIESLFSENNPPKLRNSLRADIAANKSDDPQSHIDVTHLEKKVRGTAAKLYCVLLLLDQSQLIVVLLHANPPITDDIFDKMHGDFGPYCSLEFLQNCPDLHHIAEDVFKHQWCIPPIFQPEAHGKYEAAWDLRFPFLTEPKRIGGGSFGEVFEVQVADEHLEAEDHIPVGSWHLVR